MTLPIPLLLSFLFFFAFSFFVRGRSGEIGFISLYVNFGDEMMCIDSGRLVGR